MLRVSFAYLLLGSASVFAAQALSAQSEIAQIDVAIEQRLASLKQDEGPLNAARVSLVECEEGCVTPTEAVAMAFALEEGESEPGRFLLDVLGGGQSLHGNMEQLFFVNSRAAYAELGTLTIAFDEVVLNALLRRARACGGGLENDGQIAVKGCRREGLSDPNMFTMMQRLFKRRIVVDGDVRLQWIDARSGAPSPFANKRGENERGYFQPWVWVSDADQIVFVYDD